MSNMAAPSGVDSATWAALLRWSMKQTSNGLEGEEEAPEPPRQMSKEDREWLEAVMKDGVVDLVKRAGEIMDKLKSDCIAPSRDTGMDEGKEDEMLDLLDELQDICEQIDFAMSLCQIGGVPPLLEMCHPAMNISEELKAAALGVIATVTQNNPYTQNALFNLNALPLIVRIATALDTGALLRLKAVHALSCMIRNYPPLEDLFFSGEYSAKSYFTQEGVFIESGFLEGENKTITGAEVLAYFLNHSDLRVRRKGAFLVGALISQDNISVEKLEAYYSSCIDKLVACVSPIARVIPEGEKDHGLDVDLREIALGTLTSFAQRGKASAMMEAYEATLRESQASALARIEEGKDVENSKAEVELWATLFSVE